MEKKFKKEPLKCLACSVMVEHTIEQHEDYLAIWCEKHNTWCGDHNHESIKSLLDYQQQKREFQQGVENKRKKYYLKSAS